MTGAAAAGTVVLVDDERAMRDSISQWLGLADRAVDAYADARAALARIEADGSGFDGVVVTDLKMAGLDGMALLDAVRDLDADIPVVLITGHGDVASAVRAMGAGAHDFVEKPFRPERLLSTIERALETRALVLQNRTLRASVAAGGALEHRLLGECEAMRRVRREIVDLAPVDVDVLVVGETGTGKELIARALHEHGPRAAGPFRAIDCGAIPEDRVETELFGEGGAGGGAGGGEGGGSDGGGRPGPFELASGGTLLLDEIVNMPPAQQVRLLRALESREVRRVGASEARAVDVRTVAAANDGLDAALEGGSFRKDLYFRLARLEIRVPPMRERGDDSILLFEHFARLAAASFERPLPALSAPDVAALRSHAWPGNVRELRNVAERFVLYGERRVAALLDAPEAGPSRRPLAEQVQAFERAMIEHALRRAKGDLAAVTEELGLPRRTLNDKLARYGIDRDGFGP